jgi:hypothetical protein
MQLPLTRLVLGTAVALAVSAAAAEAQYRHPSGIRSPAMDDLPSSVSIRAESQQPAVWPYALVGALVGGAYAGFWYADRGDDAEGWGGGVMPFTLAIAGGMLIGFVAGSIVGHVVRAITR